MPLDRSNSESAKHEPSMGQAKPAFNGNERSNRIENLCSVHKHHQKLVGLVSRKQCITHATNWYIRHPYKVSPTVQVRKTLVEVDNQQNALLYSKLAQICNDATAINVHDKRQKERMKKNISGDTQWNPASQEQPDLVFGRQNSWDGYSSVRKAFSSLVLSATKHLGDRLQVKRWGSKLWSAKFSCEQTSSNSRLIFGRAKHDMYFCERKQPQPWHWNNRTASQEQGALLATVCLEQT